MLENLKVKENALVSRTIAPTGARVQTRSYFYHMIIDLYTALSYQSGATKVGCNFIWNGNLRLGDF